MSWSIIGIPVPEQGKTIAESVESKRSAQCSVEGITQDLDSAEVRDQLAAAASAIEALIKSGSCGAGPFIANVNGHANPGHAPRIGWVNDFVSVTLQRA